MRTLFEHTVLGATDRLNLARGYAACRLCGRVFQPKVNRYLGDGGRNEVDYDFQTEMEAEEEIAQWRRRHNTLHSEKEHLALAESGMTFTPEAAMALAPLGIVSIEDAEVTENAEAMLEAPRQSSVEIETTLKGWR